MTVVTDTDQSLGTRAKVAWNEFAARRLGTGPLTEFTVVEVGVAGPFATCTLADLGAEVVKVEALDSYDAMHEWGRGHYGRSLWWPVQAANKELLTIDLGREKDRNSSLSSCSLGDVLVDSLHSPATCSASSTGSRT